MVQMLKDKNLVRHLKACETMGNATTICTDKTGTLTMNEMTVMKGIILDIEFEVSDKSRLQEITIDVFCRAVNINSTAYECAKSDGIIEFIGSRTEIALLAFTRSLGYDYQLHRKNAEVLQVSPFSSETKTMSTVTRVVNQPILFIKGASEIILNQSRFYMNEKNEINEFTEQDRARYADLIESYASKAFRTIAVAYKELKADENTNQEELILLGILALRDPVRPGVPDAVKKCQQAGISVRIVTGDNKSTAIAIASECGIIFESSIIIEGPQFRSLSDQERKEILPRLSILARATPSDKSLLVKSLKELGETVAVTGDGTNDAPALKAADVGFSMGISGTDIAKQASDIVLLDDDFISIVRSVIWGRSVYTSLQKFLQFQLTINSACLAILL